MNNRPRRSIKPPPNLKEYIIAAEADIEDDKELLKHKTEKLSPHISNDSVLKCKKCDVHFKTRSQLLNHVRKHKGKENFLCEECGKSLSSYQAFSEHMNIHENFKPHKCEVCGHESRQLSVHSRHMLTHDKSLSREFKCSVCSKTFKQKEYLKQHMRKHLGEKPYKCEECCKSFTAKTELNRHRACHSALRPYSCDHCNKKFKLKHNLNAHVKAHTGIQLWKCCLCKASFPQQCLMEKHKRQHTEMIQQLELVKTDQRTLTITSYPLDRRKVLHQQKVTLPSKLDLNDSENVFNAKVSLALNDTFIPISVIANSFGTGNYIKMKIVDQISLGSSKSSAAATKKLPTSIGVTDAADAAVIVDEESTTSEENGDGHRLGQQNCQTDDNNYVNSDRKSCTGEDGTAGEAESVLPIITRFQSHFDCFEKAFSVDRLDDAKIAWLRSLIDIVQELTFPLHQLVCRRLHSVIVKLQMMLISNTPENDEHQGQGPSTLDLHAPSCEFCTLVPSSSAADVSRSAEYDGVVQKNNDATTTSESQQFQSFDEVSPPPPSIDEESSSTSKNSEKPKVRVMLCNSKEDGERVKRGRLKELHKFYLILLKVLQNHFKIIFE